MDTQKVSQAEFMALLDGMTPEQLKRVAEIVERMLAERRAKDSLDNPPQA